MVVFSWRVTLVWPRSESELENTSEYANNRCNTLEWYSHDSHDISTENSSGSTTGLASMSLR